MQTESFPKLTTFETSLLFFCQVKALVLVEKYFHAPFQVSAINLSSVDKKRGDSNAFRVEEGICFPLVEQKSVDNIFLMFEKQNKMKHTV